ncbi:Minus-end-directed kinesin ATPase [Handroanthus impetiginosus]|uniref:Minus-end-directed kinesin ATPase n=1 Tax=Handroanthus impetiginosus TaxID=429701 RepID=A0A2G9H404_9LAMI|nr:Minus-end-directed kinesin ATPase [Handroanthus impetiginosus]
MVLKSTRTIPNLVSRLDYGILLMDRDLLLSDIDLASRKAEEASLRRYEATGWLRKMVGVVASKDFLAQSSEEEFRLGLRSGIILCNVLNKVVEAPSDTIIIPDGAALSAFQFFENVRNFPDSVEEMGIPAFDASDLEQGGKSSRIVNCVLALKSYHECKQGGTSNSLHVLIHELLSDKSQEDILLHKQEEAAALTKANITEKPERMAEQAQKMVEEARNIITTFGNLMAQFASKHGGSSSSQ